MINTLKSLVESVDSLMKDKEFQQRDGTQKKHSNRNSRNKKNTVSECFSWLIRQSGIAKKESMNLKINQQKLSKLKQKVQLEWGKTKQITTKTKTQNI